MKKLGFILVAILMVATVVLAACAQPTTTAPATTTQPQNTTTTTTTTTPTDSTGLGLQDAAWAQTVAAAKKEGTLLWYGGNAMKPDQIKAITDVFKARYGIDVQTLVINTATTIQRVQTEQASGAYTADIVTGAYGPLGQAIVQNNFLVPVADLGPLPVQQLKGVWNIDPFAFTFDPNIKALVSWGPTGAPGGIPALVNTQAVPADKMPKSFLDLLDPFWKGKLIMNDPTQPSFGIEYIGILYLNGTIPLDYWHKLAVNQNLVLTRTNNDLSTKVASGEYALAVEHTSTTALPLYAAGMPIKPLWFKEGVEIGPNGVGVVAHAPHPNAAKVFLNWMLTQEGQDILMKTQGLWGLRKDVPDYTPENLRIPANIPLLTLTPQVIDWTTKSIADHSIAKLMGLE